MHKGSALLITVLILTTILGAFATLGAYAFLNEKSALRGALMRRMADTVATGCMEEALGRLAQNQSYAGNETVTIAGSTCTIRPVTIAGSTWILEVETTVSGVNARLRATATSRLPITTTNWEWVTNF